MTDEVAAIERLLRSAGQMCGTDDRLWRHFMKGMSERVIRAIHDLWHWQAHGGQREPIGDWRVWLLMAGRGFGKTRAGAEWISARARENPEAAIALVGATREEVAKVMIEGPSGLIAVARTGEELRWVPTNGALEFASGAMAHVYSAAASESLRGPQHHFAWADELAKWGPTPERAQSAWDNLMMGLRLGDRPRAVVTTTPKNVPLVRHLLAAERVATTGGRTDENPHLSEDFLAWATANYGTGRLARQELHGELIDNVEGAMFTREMFERMRVRSLSPGALAAAGRAELVRVVIGVDPPASAGGTCGIVVCGGDRDGLLWVLADCSVSGLRPEGWARAVAAAAQAWNADRVIAEKNQGGDMVESVLRSAGPSTGSGQACMLPVKLVSASRGKSARAEPVAALAEAGRLRLAGDFPELEDELAGLLTGGGYAGPGRSPDRADAMVWAMHALMRRSAPPRIVAL